MDTTKTADIPHIETKRESSSWNGWCVHYNGLFDRMEKRTVCEAGQNYDSVEAKVRFTTGSGAARYQHTVARPCFKREHHLTAGCPKCRFPTEAEIAAHEEEANQHMRHLMKARKAIIEHAENKWGVRGEFSCPVCASGQLRYSISGSNGHVHASCTTPKCVAWME